MCLSRVDCFVGLNWLKNEWTEFWTAEKKKGLQSFKTNERTFRVQTAKTKEKVYDQPALYLEFSGVVNTAIERMHCHAIKN